MTEEKAHLLFEWKQESHLPPIYMSLIESAMLHANPPLEQQKICVKEDHSFLIVKALFSK